MYKKYLLTLIAVLFIFNAFSQKKPSEKYPSLLWEITGNGLTRPSYLFGTMHVSNKLAFHLSDSFYYALKSVDAVALELNPELWQGQMARLDKLKENYAAFVQIAGNDLLNENTFRLQDYTSELTAALRTEPSVVNNLLYRSYKAKEDFEEDTFLDLYIYQTGRKLGKRAAGVEDYYEAEKLVLEAYGDMAREKKKKNIDLEGENMRDIFEKVQNAYRRGDLDLMDSLDNLMERSEAFREKFLFKRNEIQANSIDSIIKNASLFAGVGAAHLPGARGVIELLREKGYKLRPVKMTDRDGTQRNEIDNLRVPVNFETRVSEDGFYKVDVPGELFRINQDYNAPDRRQFADMNNGSYYIVTRVPTHGTFLGESEKKVLFKIDSLLYENIPGKILSKKEITRNNYKGFDINARTRRGDLQRYNIFVTPFEILIFKMSGKEDYVSGKEAARFFSSIILREENTSAVKYTPASGGFTVDLPHAPHVYLNTISADNRWEYEATDLVKDKAYLILKNSNHNFSFINEDTFNLLLMEESFRNDDLFDRQLNRKILKINNKYVLQVKEKLKNGSIILARFFMNGPHQYIAAVKSNDSLYNGADFFNSFHLQEFKYNESASLTDTFLNIKVNTSVVPVIDEGIRSIIERNAEDAANGNNYSGYISYWPKPKNGIFRSEETGEMVFVQVQQMPEYFYIRDSVKYWQDEVEEYRKKNDMIVQIVSAVNENGISGLHLQMKDTGSTAIINKLLLLKNNYKYVATYMGEETADQQAFAVKFVNSFKPVPRIKERNIYESMLPAFFDDLFSKDSIKHVRALQAIPNIYYGIEGVPVIKDAIRKLNTSDKDYYEIKNKLIAELGYIRDSSGKTVVPFLNTLYKQTADTSQFQNEVIKSLARLQTKESYQLFNKLVLKDPPVFDNTYDLNALFSQLKDTLSLSASLYPDLLQLSTLDDYKEKVFGLLVKGVDSGFIERNDYKKYYEGILIDAKVAYKKQRNRDDKRLQAELKNKDAGPVRIFRSMNSEEITLNDYAVLLMPFYDRKKEVRTYFDGLLQLNNGIIRMNTAVLMLRNNKAVAGSILDSLAADDKYRGALYDKLSKNSLQQYFPAKYADQKDLIKSYLIMENDYDKMDSLVFVSKQMATHKGKTGYVFFYKYRIQKDNDWKIAMAGVQPEDSNLLSSEPGIAILTDIKLKEDEPETEQFSRELKKIIITSHKGGRSFYSDRENFSRFN